MYCQGNPVLYEDPTGHFIWLIPVVACAAAAIIAGGLSDSGGDTGSATTPSGSTSTGSSGGSGGSGQLTAPTPSPGNSDGNGTSGQHDAALRNMADHNGGRGVNPSGRDVKNTLRQNLEKNDDGSIKRDSEGRAWSRIGNTRIAFQAGVGDVDSNLSRDDNDTSLSVLGRMAGSPELGLTEIEISCLYTGNGYPHSAGRGIDIKSMKSTTGSVKFDDSDYLHPVVQNQLGVNVTNWLKNQPEVSQVLTPWSMYSKVDGYRWDVPNDWRARPRVHEGLDLQHNNHLHFGICGGL